MAKIQQASMAAGEISPAVGARVDVGYRNVAVELAENFIMSYTGQAFSRPGQKFVARTKPGSTQYRIIDFEFSVTQTYILELGNQYMRFYTNGAQILDSSAVKTITAATVANPVVVTSTAHGLSNGDEVYITGVTGMTELNGRNFLIANVAANTFELQDLDGNNIDGTGYTAYSSGGTATPPYEISTPWAAADLFDINYAQSGDVMTLVHPDYTPRELVRVANDNWTLSELTFLPEQVAPDNIDAVCNTAINAKAITGATQANPCVLTVSGHGLSDGNRVLVEGVTGMTELNNFIYRINVLSANTFELRYLNGDNVDSSGFTAYSSGGTATEEKRMRQYVVTAVNEDDEEESLRATSIRDISITNVSQANPAVVTTSAGHGLESLEEIEISGIVGMTELNGERFETVFIDATSFSLKRLDGTAVDSTGFTAYSSSGTAKPLFIRVPSSADSAWDNTVFWDAAANAQRYNVYASDNFGVFGYIGSTTKLQFDDINIAPEYDDTPPILYNPFDSFVSGTDKQPAAVGFYEQRRWFGNSNSFPNRFWASQTGHFDNLSRSSPAQDTDSIVATIAARRINEIKHIIPLSDVIFMTSGGEYRGYSESGVITPTTIQVKPQSYWGTTALRPIVAGDVGLFVSPGSFVRDFSYQFDDDKFVGKDLTEQARHLFDYRTFVDWDYASAPYSIAFGVMSDGDAVVLTYKPGHTQQHDTGYMFGWTRATTYGKYKSVAVIRENEADIVYVLVERIINGTTVTFVERMDERDFEVLSDAFCVDAGVTLDSPITITNMTAASPVVVTATAHGLSDGDTVDISDVVEVTTSNTQGVQVSSDYNGTGFTVANSTANTFELQIEGVDYDGSGFAAYSSGGKAREAVTTVTGLWHLEGETVVAAGNGYSQQGLTVANGSVTLTAPASRIHVGLMYTPKLRSLNIEQYSNGQTTVGQAKNINRLSVEVERTMGLWYGTGDDDMREYTFGVPSLYGQPLELVTAVLDMTAKGNWKKNKQVQIEQRDPLPLTVLSLIPDMQLGGN